MAQLTDALFELTDDGFQSTYATFTLMNYHTISLIEVLGGMDFSDIIEP